MYIVYVYQLSHIMEQSKVITFLVDMFTGPNRISDQLGSDRLNKYIGWISVWFKKFRLI